MTVVGGVEEGDTTAVVGGVDDENHGVVYGVEEGDMIEEE